MLYVISCSLYSWFNRRLIDICVDEFRLYPRVYYVSAIEGGLVTLNEKKATLESFVRQNDLITHKAHRHEPPILNKLSILGESEDYLAVLKPSSVPIHPSGAYYYNTLTSILNMARKDLHLYTVHRLDKLTSGVVVFAKSKEAASSLSQQIKDKQAYKLYLARINHIVNYINLA